MIERRAKLSVLTAMAFALAVILVVSSGAIGARANASFSPVNVWSNDLGVYGDIKTVIPSMDADGDDLAEMVAEVTNYSSGTYTVVILNGSSGGIMHSRTFTDVGYAENGDQVAINPTLYGLIIEDSSGTPVKEWKYMVFANHSNVKHVSIYHLDYPTLATKEYRGIDVPQNINMGGFNIPVSTYNIRIHIFSAGNDAYLLFEGYYEGQLFGQIVGELQVMVMNETLQTIWEHVEKGVVYNSLVPFAATPVQFNGDGFNGDYDSVLLINLTASPGNTTLIAIDSVSGSELWNLTVPGAYFVMSPIYPMITEMDYNKDSRADMALITFDTNKNETHVNFIDSSGTLLGYYTTDIHNVTIPAIVTDVKNGNFHLMVQTVDFNGDGNGEFVLVDNNTRMVCWDIAANTTLWIKYLQNQSYQYIPYLSTSDINGDGTWDLYFMGSLDNNTGNNHGKDVNMTAVSGKDGSIIYSSMYYGLVSGYSGTVFLKEISDIDGDGIQDSAIAAGFFNDGTGVYVNVSAISMKDPSTLWTVKVGTDLNNEDYQNWSVQMAPCEDINGDGVNDMVVKMYYHPSADQETTYIRILSGSDGSLLWTGKVSDDTTDTEITVFSTFLPYTSWNQFDYNGDGQINEILLYTSTGVYVYAVSQPIPEISAVIPVVFFAATLIAMRKKIRHL